MKERIELYDFKLLQAAVVRGLDNWCEAYQIFFTEEQQISHMRYILSEIQPVFRDRSRKLKDRVKELSPRTAGVNIHRWARFKLDERYIIANLPKKQAILVNENGISIHGLDESIWQKNVKLVKDIIKNAKQPWAFFERETDEYKYWRGLMSRWNTYADKTTPVTDLRVTKD